MDTKTTTSKQTSRKGKKAWRKNVDVADINEGLENLRTELRAGGVISEKPDEALFAVDTVGSASIQKKVLARQRITKPLRADEILSQRSAVPALESRKRGAASDSSSIIGDGIVRESSRAAKKRKGEGISFKELQRLRRIAYGDGVEGQDLALKGSEGIEGKELYDAWGDGDKGDAMIVAAGDEEEEEDNEEEKEKDKYSFLEKKKPKVAPVTLKHKPISLTASKAPIPAVRLPDPGISYNPEFEKWDQLLTKEGDKEVEVEKKRLAEKAYEEHIRQMTLEEDPKEGEESDEEEDSSESDGGEKKDQFVKKRPERKTQAQRNKIKRRKEAERELKRLEHIRKQKEQLQAIKKLARAVEEKERLKLQQLATTGEVDDPDADIETLRKKRFGKRHIPQAPLELKLPDELTESLRLLKPEGNLVRDRYRSFLERGILETRAPVSHRKKAKTYTSEKWSYKDWTW